MAYVRASARTSGAFVLPGLLAATYVQQKTADAGITIAYEDEESLGPQGQKLELKTKDGKLLYDDDVLRYFQDNYQVAQAGNKEQVSSRIYF